MFSNFFKKKPKPAEVYSGLRDRILNLKPTEVGVIPSNEIPNVWGILMETRRPQAVVTLISLADGTTSLYFSNGGGMIGGGEHITVAQASKSFVAAAEKYYRQMTLAETFPSPAIDRVKFYALTFSGIFTIDIDENELGNKKHELSPLFYSGQNVIMQFRMVQEQKK